MELIVVSQRVCPNCSWQPSKEGNNYECPKCGKGFCSQCYKIVIEGDGSFVKCPLCGQVLYFPGMSPKEEEKPKN